MKFKTLFHLMGLKPRTREYGYKIRTFDLPREGQVEYAQWQHPKDLAEDLRQQEVDLLREFIQPGDVAIDVGAHTGDSTLPIALAAGSEGQVLALEPNPYVYRVLAVNAKLNPDKTSIIALPFAATEEDGPMEFEYSDAGYCNGGRHEGIPMFRHGHAFKLTVQGRNLSKYLHQEHADLLGRLRYIKTDAEGYDATILESIRGIIETARPYIKAEVYKHTNQQQRVRLLQLLTDMDYHVRRIVGPTQYFGEPVTSDNVCDWRHYDVLCIPGEKAAQHRQVA